MKTVLLISGKLRSGKNQLADYIQDILKSKNIKVSTESFASTLKDWCKQDFKPLANTLANIREEIKCQVNLLFDQPGKFVNPAFESTMKSIYKTLDKLTLIEDNWYENKTEISRILLQLVGTDIFRKRVDNDWWANRLVERCIKCESEFILITDCRFPTELLAFNKYINKDFNVVAIRVNRNINTRTDIASHESETALDTWDAWNYIIDNNGTLNDLKNSADCIVTDIFKEIQENI